MKLVELLNVLEDYTKVSVMEFVNDGYDCLFTGVSNELPYRVVSKYVDRKVVAVNSSGDMLFITVK